MGEEGEWERRVSGKVSGGGGRGCQVLLGCENQEQAPHIRHCSAYGLLVGVIGYMCSEATPTPLCRSRRCTQLWSC